MWIEDLDSGQWTRAQKVEFSHHATIITSLVSGFFYATLIAALVESEKKKSPAVLISLRNLSVFFFRR